MSKFAGKIERGKAIKILRALVSIRSINPLDEKVEQLEYTEKAVGDYVENYLSDLELETKRQKVLKNRENIIGRLKGKTAKESLVFETHMDTVQVTNMTIEPFSGFVENDKLYGRGACDAKGSLASMLLALELLKESKIKPGLDIYLAAVVDEEYAYRGVRRFLGSGFRPTAAVVGEPTGLNIVIAHKGYIRFRIEVLGKSAHSAVLNKGVNAIYKMSEVMAELRNNLEPRYAQKVHRWVGAPTFNVGTIKGGHQSNIVPDRCIIEIDRRVVPGESHEEALSEIEELLKELQSKDRDLKVRLEPPFGLDYPMEVSSEEPVVQAMERACEKVMGRAELCGVPYTTDASKFTILHIPAIVFGPGSIEQAHSAVEWVELSQVMQAAEILAQLALEF